MRQDLLRAYTAVALDAALGVREGSKLRVMGAPSNRELMHAIAEGAYKRGASLVRLEYQDERLERIRADFSRDEYLDAVPALVERQSEVYEAEGWASLRLVGDEDPDALVGADEGRLARIERSRSIASKRLRAAYMSSRLPWSVMPAATEAWAAKVLGAGAGPGSGAERLWEILAGILRLDQPDPAAELRAHMEAVDARARALNALGLRELRFLGPGTDLRVRLASCSTWMGGADKTPDGRPFMPNIPTEECFTTPDFRGTEGRAALTRPVRILGSLVVGGYLRFEGGLVVEAGAESGAESLRSYIATDRGARRLGEVALVDSANPIGKSGLVFDSALIDENAACHIALGAGYEPAFEGADGWGEDDKEERGFNVSVGHEDVMIGSPEVDVTGIDASGREIALLRRGSFVL